MVFRIWNFGNFRCLLQETLRQSGSYCEFLLNTTILFHYCVVYIKLYNATNEVAMWNRVVILWFLQVLTYGKKRPFFFQ